MLWVLIRSASMRRKHVVEENMRVLIRCASNEYLQHMFLLINVEHYQRFITKYLSLTSLLQRVKKNTVQLMQLQWDLRSGHFQVKTSTEMIIFYFNDYSLLGENFNRQHFEIFFLFSPESRLQHFIQIATFRNNWHDVKSSFREK